MVTVSHREPSEVPLPERFSVGTRVLIIWSPYYSAVAGELLAGATAVLERHGVRHDAFPVPGALEIPQALAAAHRAGLVAAPSESAPYRGVIAIGCVVRGETSHYDIVCANANHWLMETAIRNAIPVGNAILTVDTLAQAEARAAGGEQGKGGDAARAVLSLIALSEDLGGRAP